MSFWSVDSLVGAFDLPLCPRDKRNVIRGADLFPNVPHHAEERHGVHEESVTHLSVGLSSDERPKYDCLYAGQRWVQPES